MGKPWCTCSFLIWSVLISTPLKSTEWHWWSAMAPDKKDNQPKMMIRITPQWIVESSSKKGEDGPEHIVNNKGWDNQLPSAYVKTHICYQTTCSYWIHIGKKKSWKMAQFDRLIFLRFIKPSNVNLHSLRTTVHVQVLQCHPFISTRRDITFPNLVGDIYAAWALANASRVRVNIQHRRPSIKNVSFFTNVSQGRGHENVVGAY